MHRFEESFVVRGRTADEVFDFIADPAHGADWISAVKDVRAEGDPAVGRELHARARLLGVEFTTVSVVTAHDRPDHYAFSGQKPFFSEFDFRFADTDDGTRVDATFTTDPGSFFKVGGRLVARTMEKQFRGDLDNVRRELST